MNTKTERIIGLLNKVVENRNGNRVRHLTRIIANSYKDRPDELLQYFTHKNEYLSGISTSAYALITKDISKIYSLKYGGLGAIIEESEEGLYFGKRQLWFSKNTGNSFKNSENQDLSFNFSENKDNAFQGAKNKDNSFFLSKNAGNSFKNSENLGESFQFSENKDNAFQGAKNKDNSFFLSKNSGNSFKDSQNSGGSFLGALNIENSLKFSQNSEFSLHEYIQ